MVEKNIFITGFMGTGKSAVGECLAQKTGKVFLDMDKVIESQEGNSIKEIFASKGENYFRSLETRILKEISSRQGIIVATGGGALLSEENYQLACNGGYIVLLWATPEVILERLKKEKDIRPLLSGSDRLEKIKMLLQQRKEKYNRIKYQIETTNLSIDQVAKAIIELFQIKEVIN
ncbi:MAG: shikimate kinase [Candidatus Caldatribacteriota bacterium]